MKEHKKPTDGELSILNVLWQNGPSSVRDVHEELGTESKYTTTLKLLQIMYEKGYVKRDDSAKTHIYEAVISREDTQDQYLQKMIDTVFNGSASKMVMQALGRHKATPEELDEIKKYLDDIDNK